MAVVTSAGSRIMVGLTSTPSVLADAGEGGGRMKKWVETVETSAADSGTSTYLMARLPSNARIFGSSQIAHDTLGATTTAMYVGVFNTSSSVTHITNAASALHDAIVTSTAGTKNLILDPAKWGKRLYEIAGASSDPKCDLDIKLTLDAVHLSSGAGTVTVEIDYACD
jgi:hypothetical protein